MSGQITKFKNGNPVSCSYEGDACRTCPWRENCTLTNKTFFTPPDVAEFARREMEKVDAE